jgi:hypothetical protein
MRLLAKNGMPDTQLEIGLYTERWAGSNMMDEKEDKDPPGVS